MIRRAMGIRVRPPFIVIVPRRLTNVAADKHFWIACYARISRCACSRTKALDRREPSANTKDPASLMVRPSA